METFKRIFIWTARVIFMIVLSLLAGGLGTLFMRPSSMEWYAGLEKPPLSPPSWIFGIVWPILYVLMGLAAGIIWNIPVYLSRVRQALALFAIQLVLNACWTLIFFGLRMPGWAWVEIFILWLFILVTEILFFQQSKTAGVLLWPYLVWVTFAMYLNAGYWILNH